LFATNQVTNGNGGAVFNNSGTSGNSSPSFMNVTFYNNSANSGTILYASENGNTTITNAILWDTTTSSSLNLIVLSDSSATASITYSDITGGWPSGVSNINADPMFTDESNLIGPDGIWATNDDGLTLQPGSPALATGTSTGAPTTDIIGNPQTTPASMGCYIEVLLPANLTGKGTIAGGSIIFNVKATHNSQGQIVADMFYNDKGAKVHFDNPVVTNLTFSENQATLGGTVRVQGRNVIFTATLTGGNPGTLSVSLSNGYFASGNLTSGSISIQ
jgi:hypothetical protein